MLFFSRPSPKVGRELQTALNRIMEDPYKNDRSPGRESTQRLCTCFIWHSSAKMIAWFCFTSQNINTLLTPPPPKKDQSWMHYTPPTIYTPASYRLQPRVPTNQETQQSTCSLLWNRRGAEVWNKIKSDNSYTLPFYWINLSCNSIVEKYHTRNITSKSQMESI